MDQQRMRELSTMEYQLYLQTPEWKQKRALVLQRDGYACRLCHKETSLQVHHRTYARRGHEDLNDLTTLCQECHEQFHLKSERLQTTSPPPPIHTHEQHVYRWEDHLTGMLLLHPELLPSVSTIIAAHDFLGTDTQALYLQLTTGTLDRHVLSPAASRCIEKAKATMPVETHDQVKCIVQLAARLKHAQLARANREVDQRIRTLAASGQTTALRQLMKQKQHNAALLRSIETTTHLMAKGSIAHGESNRDTATGWTTMPHSRHEPARPVLEYPTLSPRQAQPINTKGT